MKRLALLALVLAAGCATPLTPSRLAPSFATTFSGLYAQQQQHDGRTDLLAAGLQTRASCRRNGPDQKGPGEDWSCVVRYIDAGAPQAHAFEVQLKPDGCWRAEGSPVDQPALRTDPRSGQTRVNPLAEFDGCLDTSWR